MKNKNHDGARKTFGENMMRVLNDKEAAAVSGARPAPPPPPGPQPNTPRRL